MDTGLDSAVLQVLAEHHEESLDVGQSYFSPVRLHSAIRWRWSWLTDPDDARDVFDTARDLAERGLLEELPARSKIDPFFDYRMTEMGYAYLGEHPPPHPCQPPPGFVVDPPKEWICPDCRTVFRPRISHDQINLYEPSRESHPARWEKVRDGAA